MNCTKGFGEKAEGYSFPVLNEREVRAAAGILFLATFTSFFFVLFRNDFLLIKYVITGFLIDFIIRVFINPKFSPTLIAGRLIVHNQTPEYVDAQPKQFAWRIGVSLSSIMFVLLVVINSYSVLTGVICIICLVFLFFEAVFGICLGCLFYPLFYKERSNKCAGEVCERKPMQLIQTTSGLQKGILLGFVIGVLLMILLFNDRLSKRPNPLFNTEEVVVRK